MAQSQARQRKQKTAHGTGPATARAAMPPVDVQELANFNGRNMEVAMRMGQAMFDSMATMNQELLKFVGTRLQEDLKTARSLSECRHPSEFVDCELRFLQTCIQHYADNTNRMLGIAANAVRHGADDVEEVITDLAKTAEAATD